MRRVLRRAALRQVQEENFAISTFKKSMTRFKFTLLISIAAAGAAFAQTSAAVKSGKSYTPPKTAWGDPDLQGVWPGNMGVPMQRPEALGTRAELNDQEFAQREEQARKQLAADAES